MGRITQKEPNGRWRIRGVEFASLPSAVYGALCKLLDYEDTGLSPGEIERMKYNAEEIHIGSVIQGYQVFGIHNDYCIAHSRTAPTTYAVWHIDADKHGVHTGSYFGTRQEAEKHFMELAFSDVLYMPMPD